MAGIIFFVLSLQAETLKQVRVDSVLKRPNFSCSGNKVVEVGTDAVFCDQVVDGKHMQFRVSVKADVGETFLLRGRLQEIDQDGAVSHVNELGIRALNGEPAEIQSGDISQARQPLGNWIEWTVKADTM